MARQSLANRLYTGETSFEFIAHRRRWYALSGTLVLISILSLAILGINPSIDFKGGDVFQFPQHGHSQSDVRQVFEDNGVTPEVVQTTNDGDFRVETKSIPQASGNDQVSILQAKVASAIGIKQNDITVQSVGSTWGGQITKKAITGLIVFLIAVIIYLSFRFEWKMAVAAIAALLHDLVVTAGVYSLSGFEVSPSTVIALLTILGYSLYDTVVVFDKVRENTAGLAGGSRMTYSQAANLGVNQTLVRSINTSVIALLPVAGLLIIGAGFLGAGSLKDLSLALLIGLAFGAYSSIYLAPPIVADLKEREPTYQQLARRVAARKAKEAAPAVPATAGAPLREPARNTPPAAAAPAPAYDEGGADATPTPPAPAARPASPGPRPGSRPQQRRGGRPGGRGGRSRRRR